MSEPTQLLPSLMLTPQEVARRFSVHPRTVLRWCAEGRLRSFRAGKVVRIYPEDVVAALDAGRLPGEPA